MVVPVLFVISEPFSHRAPRLVILHFNNSKNPKFIILRYLKGHGWNLVQVGISVEAHNQAGNNQSRSRSIGISENRPLAFDYTDYGIVRSSIR